jgi:hypothetical protein
VTSRERRSDFSFIVNLQLSQENGWVTAIEHNTRAMLYRQHRPTPVQEQPYIIVTEFNSDVNPHLVPASAKLKSRDFLLAQ